MHTRLVRLAALAAVALLAACGDKEAGSALLDDVEEGMTRDAVLTKIGQGPMTAEGNDSLRVVNGWRRMRFLQNGAMYEVIFVRETPGKIGDPLEQEKESPIVLRADTVIGTGWSYYANTAMKEAGLPNPVTPKIDSSLYKPKPGQVGPAATPTPPADTNKQS